MTRGYLWTNLQKEIASEFAQPHPFVQLYDSIPFWQKFGWHIEGTLGDMSGVRKSEKRRRGEGTSTEGVKEIRARRKAEGRCIDCEKFRHPKSKNYCAEHREKDREKAERRRAMRKRLPDDRVGFTNHFKITAKAREGEGVEEIDGYIQTGTYPDGKLGEIFLKVSTGDEFVMLDMWAISTSVALQYGAPVDDLFLKFVGQRFWPDGATTNKDIPRCTSPVDYASRWILQKYGSEETVKRLFHK